LAFSVRVTLSGTGPITGNDLANTYNIETGQPAGEGVLAQLQRLPGLTQRDQEAGSRSFVDADMLAVLQGSALARIIWGQYKNIGDSPLSALSENAVNVAAFLLRRDGGTSSTPLSIVERLSKETSAPANAQLAADCFTVSLSMSRDEAQFLDCHGLNIESASLVKLDLEDHDLKNVRFSDCLINEVVVGSQALSAGVNFSNCIIRKVRGVASEAGLPGSMFSGSCEIEEYDDMGTNSAVLRLDLEPQVKALLTILRKLYRQSGAGRKIATLSRGITSKEVVSFIPPVLGVLEKQGFARVFNHVVHPVRRRAGGVESILNAPSLSTDELMDAVKQL